MNLLKDPWKAIHGYALKYPAAFLIPAAKSLVRYHFNGLKQRKCPSIDKKIVNKEWILPLWHIDPETQIDRIETQGSL